MTLTTLTRPEPVDGIDRVAPISEPDRRRVEFEAFFDRHHRELGRLSYLLTDSVEAAEDLTSECFLVAWAQWDRVTAADEPFAYVRRVMANLAATRIRRLATERRRLGLLRPDEVTEQGDRGDVVDVRAALARLPAGQRACVVLRHAFDLSEKETAAALGISVGGVKSQTSKGMARLSRLLGPAEPARWSS